jgi:TolB-like protein/DNA-binding winged helix-turn-helix (wHTH) protein
VATLAEQATAAAVIDLAREPDFALGPATARPSIAEVVMAGQTIRLQPRVMQVLVALVRRGGEVVTRDELIANCWGGLAIGDDAINRCIGRLRRLAEEEIPGAFAIETLPRIGYRLTQRQLPGAPKAARWPRLTRRRLGIVAGAFVAIAVGLWMSLGEPGLPPGPSGVAVMPFDAASDDPVARTFEAGVANEVAGALAKSALKVAPADTGSNLTGLQRDSLSQRLGAAFTLSGRVQRSGDHLAVTVALDDAQRHDILWSADFTRAATQAQDLQAEVAARVAEVLRCALDANNFQGGRIDLESLRLYLRACDRIRDATDDAGVRDLFRQVVARQPGFANAWGRFAMSSAFASETLPAPESGVAAAEARAAAERALTLDPKAALGYGALATLASDSRNFGEAQEQLLKGLVVAPDSAIVNFEESNLLGATGRTGESVAYARRASTLDPLSPFFTSQLAINLAQSGHLAEARATMAHAATVWPDHVMVRGARLSIEARYGDPAIALAILEDPNQAPSEASDAELADSRSFVLTRQSGDPARLAAYAKQVLDDVASKQLDPSQAVLRLSTLGAVDAAFAAAAQATPEQPLDTEILFRGPATAMRADPRFMPLAAKWGLVAFWRRTGVWPDFCLAQNRPYDCKAEAAKLGP